MTASDSNRASALKQKVRRVSNRPGVYLMKDRLGQVIYVGKAKDLKKRVSSYFQPSRSMVLQPKIRSLVGVIADFDFIEVGSEPEALLLEGRLIKEWRPKYNTDFTDDKRFPLIRVDLASDLPRFSVVRFRKDDSARYFGPFAHSGPMRRTLNRMHRQFGILLSDATPRKLEDGRYRLYDDVRAELSGHPNMVSPDEYRERVDQACMFLEGKSREWLDELKNEMAAAAEALEYEKAAELRDVIVALETTLAKTRPLTRRSLPAPDPTAGGKALKESLALPHVPRAIECFDISHISGTFVVASLIRFADGKPDKKNFRRFRIKGFIGNDDYRAMEEVVARRYRRLAAEARPLPDLVVIDGGRGQVGAALKAFISLDLKPPSLVGLAKREETIVFTDERPPLRLPADHPGLRLLQRVRDEAHRFANTFNAELRSRRIKESILEDLPGLGPVRRRALLDHFRSLDRLRNATPDAIAAVPGIGPRFAAEVYEFLQKTSDNR